jgi:rhamnose utilization protein RhaD (predicted bifunctional aldolase and dehydrogenase)
MTDVIQPDLQSLAKMSAVVGRDIALVQGAGGNSSAKLGDVLWVKASGTWLADAESRAIFVPVDLAVARQAIVRSDENIPALPLADIDARLRPSIETSLHALMPHRVVLHVHGVNSIAWSVLVGGEAGMAERLTGLRWSFLPYCRPGVPLSQALTRVVERDRPDVLLLGNHGLVVGAGDADSAHDMVCEVERRLDLATRTCPAPNLERLDSLAAGTVYRPAGFPECHWTALDPWSLSVAVGGSLYPDHPVFLGPGAYALAEGETPAALAERMTAQGVAVPACILVPGAGALIRRDLPPGTEAMLRCLGLVTSRLPVGAAIRYLTFEEEGALLNWDAEKYRRSLART